MTNQPQIKPNESETGFTEAPASWNSKYIHPSGFECQITLRGDTGSELLEKAQNAIDYLLEHDCQPYTYSRNGYTNSTNGNQDKASWCPIHKVNMRKWEKDGKVWYSHKVDGEWCSGK